jgi:hypothetical protein
LLSLLVLGVAQAREPADDPSFQRSPPPPRARRTIEGDLCATAFALGHGETRQVDLCEAWNDYDPGAFGCSPCALPGPDVVASFDTQPGELLRIQTSVLSGELDVRVYLATDCEDPAGSCLAAATTAAGELEYSVVGGGELFLFVDTTGECGEVQVSLQRTASSTRTTFSALKAVYR